MNDYSGSLKSYIESIPNGELDSNLADLLQNRLASIGNTMMILEKEFLSSEIEEKEEQFRDELIHTHNDALRDMQALITVLRNHISSTNQRNNQ